MQHELDMDSILGGQHVMDQVEELSRTREDLCISAQAKSRQATYGMRSSAYYASMRTQVWRSHSTMWLSSLCATSMNKGEEVSHSRQLQQ